MIIRSLMMGLTACVLLGGCAAPQQRYPNDQPKNVTIDLHYDSGSGMFGSSKAVAGINDISKDCSTHYKGRVKLKEGRNEVGLAVGQPTALVVELSESSWVEEGGHSMQRGVVIDPKPGVHYEVDVNYADAMYDIRLYRMTRTGKRRLPIHALPPGCQVQN